MPRFRWVINLYIRWSAFPKIEHFLIGIGSLLKYWVPKTRLECFYFSCKLFLSPTLPMRSMFQTCMSSFSLQENVFLYWFKSFKAYWTFTTHTVDFTATYRVAFKLWYINYMCMCVYYINIYCFCSRNWFSIRRVFLLIGYKWVNIRLDLTHEFVSKIGQIEKSFGT